MSTHMSTWTPSSSPWSSCAARELRGKPVVVATGTDAAARGVVMAASYEARRFGVHSALPLAIAHRRCPQAILVPRDIGLYRRASRKVMEVLHRFSDRVEVAGLDEAYLDLSDCPAPKARARQLKREVRAETRLVCSVGLAPNKLLAKIASDLEKPDGLCVLEPEDMLEAVGERPATLIPGVGPRTARAAGRASGSHGGRARRRRARDARAGLRPAAGPRAARPRPRPRRSPCGHRARAEVGEPRDDLPVRRLRPGDPRRYPRSPRRLALPRARRERLRGPHRDAEDTPAPLPHPHALANRRERPPATPTGCAQWPASCWPSSSSTPRCGCWGSASAASWPCRRSKRDPRTPRTRPGA